MITWLVVSLVIWASLFILCLGWLIWALHDAWVGFRESRQPRCRASSRGRLLDTGAGPSERSHLEQGAAMITRSSDSQFRSSPMQVTTVITILETAKTLLLRDGWHQGSARGPNQSRCLAQALADGGVRVGVNPVLAHEAGSEAVMRVIGGTGWHVPQWNDQPGRRLGEVIEVLDQAIKMLWAQTQAISDLPVQAVVMEKPQERHVWPTSGDGELEPELDDKACQVLVPA